MYSLSQTSAQGTAATRKKLGQILAVIIVGHGSVECDNADTGEMLRQGSLDPNNLEVNLLSKGQGIALPESD